MMDMTYGPWSNFRLTLIFDWWKIETHFQYVASWLFICLVTIFYHAVRYTITVVERKVTSKMSHSHEHKSPPDRKLSSMEIGIDEAFLASDRSLLSMNVHKSVSEQRQLLYLRALHAGLAGFSYFVALLLMLVAMSYNLGLLLAVIIGYAVGDFVFFERTVGLGLSSSKGPHSVHIDHGSHLHTSSNNNSGKEEESWLGQHKYSGECHV